MLITPNMKMYQRFEKPLDFLSFDGTDDHVNLGTPDSLKITGSVTLSMRVYVDSLASTMVFWGNYAEATGDDGNLGYVETDGSVSFHGRNGASTYLRCDTAAGTVEAGNWYHIVCMSDGTDWYVYVNGEEEAKETNGIFDWDTNKTKYIGRETANFDNWNGKISNVRIYDRALTTAEISDIYKSESLAPTDGLVSYWKLDEGTGSTANDSEGSNDGTIYGASWVTRTKDSSSNWNHGTVYGATASDSNILLNYNFEDWTGTHPVGWGVWASLSAVNKISAGTGNVMELVADDNNQITTGEEDILDPSIRNSDGCRIKMIIRAKLSQETAPGSKIKIGERGGNYLTILNGPLWSEFTSTEWTEIETENTIDISGDGGANFCLYSRLDAPTGTSLGVQIDWIKVIIYDNILKAPISHWKMNDDSTSPSIVDSYSNCNGIFFSGDSSDDIDLVAHWRMNDDADNTTVTDSSANSNGGASVNNTSTMSGVGQIFTSFQFNGTSDAISISNTADINLMDVSTRTYAFWVKADGTTSRQVIFKEGGSVNCFTIYIESNNLYVAYADSSSLVGECHGTLDDTNWHHIVFVFNSTGSEQELFIDNVSVDTDTNATAIASHSGAISLGYSSGSNPHFHDGTDANANYYDGKLDDFRIYNRVLSSDEITGLYNFGNGTEDYPDSTSSHSVTGKVGTALDFDGVDDYITIDTIASDLGTMSRSIALWFKTTTTSVFMFAFNGPGSENICLLGVAAGRLSVYDSSHNTGSIVNDGEWHHVVLTYDETGDHFNAYLDGNTTPDISVPMDTSWDTDGRVSIGQEWDSDNPSNFFEGQIDDVRIFDSVLTKNEISQLYNEGNGTESLIYTRNKLGGYYSFDGTDNYIATPIAPEEGERTLCGWVRYNTLTEDSSWGNCIIGSHDGNNRRVYISMWSGVVRCGYGDSYGGSIVVSTDTWYHVAVTMDDSTGNAKIYLNGALEVSDTYTWTTGNSTDNYTIGKLDSSHWMDGLISEVMLFDKVLSQSDIQRIMMGLHPLNG